MTTAAKRQAAPVSFGLGRLLTTPGALRVLIRLDLTPIQLIARHASGDWGDMCEEDRQANESALVNDSRIFSAYELEGVKLYVITEADRSATTVLLAEEY